MLHMQKKEECVLPGSDTAWEALLYPCSVNCLLIQLKVGNPGEQAQQCRHDLLLGKFVPYLQMHEDKLLCAAGGDSPICDPQAIIGLKGSTFQLFMFLINLAWPIKRST